MAAPLSVKQLKQILTETKSPQILIDPVTELPLWDEKLMKIIKNAKSIDEVKSVCILGSF